MLTQTFHRFFASERVGGLLLVGCTVMSLAIANSPIRDAYAGLWSYELAGHSVGALIADGLMALFFLLVGLELEREIYEGELSGIRQALLPFAAAAGGMLLPAAVHLALNVGTPTQAGAGIPIATDIAFALAVVAMLGPRVPAALKVFITALAVIDDLGAILVIAVGYSSGIGWLWLAGAAAVFAVLLMMNRANVTHLAPYLAGGVALWMCMLHSGVHPTIAGVLLAFAIPFSPRRGQAHSASHVLEDHLHRPVALVVLPLFALANTAIVIPAGGAALLASANGLGIMAGLLIGKPLGILLGAFAVVAAGSARLPDGVRWIHIAGAGIISGIGFTMSIFVANLAFPADPALVDASKMAVLAGSLGAALLGFVAMRAIPVRDS